jgi:flagellar basal-body rod protein FlgB
VKRRWQSFMGLFGNIDLMAKMLDIKLKRHELLSNNIANVDTPGYKRSDISFEGVFKDILKTHNMSLTTTNDKHIKARKHINDIKPKIYKDQDHSFRNDENNVDIDKEMVEMVKNTFSYNIVSDQIQKNFKILQTAISEGRK